MMLAEAAAAAAAAAAQPSGSPPVERSYRPVVEVALPPSAYAGTAGEAIPLVYADLVPMMTASPSAPDEPRPAPAIVYHRLDDDRAVRPGKTAK